MSQRKVLPPRTNRGRRPQQSQQQKARDDFLYSQLMQRAVMQAKQQSPKKSNQRHKLQSGANSSQLQLQYKQNMATNRLFFPYPRGYHYFFDLSAFPRLEGSQSYAIDADNVFGFTYSQEQKVINKQNGLKVGQLFNRCYFGLPLCPPTSDNGRTRDKNVCHGYLFPNEDRKFFIDRSLEELKRILSKFDKLEETGDIYKFSCLRKDVDLLPIVQDQISKQQKKNILQRKIKILQQKKQSIKNYVSLEDKNFYYHSLNQLLHNSIEQKTSQLSYKYIASEVQNSDYLRQKLRNLIKVKNGEENKQQNQGKNQKDNKIQYDQKQIINVVQKMFTFYPKQQEKVCLSKKSIQKFKEKILQQNGLFFRKQIDTGFYEMTMPFTFLNFSNNNLMSVCEKILALRLAYQNESSFYICKILWKKIFNRDLIINKEMKQLSRADYERTLSSTITQLQKFKKQQDSKPQPDPEPLCLDFLLSLECLAPSSKSLDLFPLQKSQQITMRQYTVIILFNHLYRCLTEIYQFIISNQIFSELIANQFFNKGQHYVVECMGSARIGLIDEVLRRLCEWVVRAEIEAEYKIKWVYDAQKGIGYTVKTSLEPEWETQKEDNQQQVDDKESEDIPTKRIK